MFFWRSSGGPQLSPPSPPSRRVSAEQGVGLAFNAVTFPQLLRWAVSGPQLHWVRVRVTLEQRSAPERDEGTPVWDPPAPGWTSARLREPNTSSTLTLKPFAFVSSCKPTAADRVADSLKRSAKVTHDLFCPVCLFVSVCVRAAFRRLLPPPATPTQLQLPAGRRSCRRRCLLRRPGTPVWGESSCAATYCPFTQLNPSARCCVVIGKSEWLPRNWTKLPGMSSEGGSRCQSLLLLLCSLPK